MVKKYVPIVFSLLSLLTSCSSAKKKYSAKTGYNLYIEQYKENDFEKKSCLYVSYTPETTKLYYYNLSFVLDTKEETVYFFYDGETNTDINESDYKLVYVTVCNDSTLGRIGSL